MLRDDGAPCVRHRLCRRLCFRGDADLRHDRCAGRTWSSDEIKARSELVLDQRFARIATVEQALAGPASKLAS
jgi:hypothetical protein